jgi:hypothetical protein
MLVLEQMWTATRAPQVPQAINEVLTLVDANWRGYLVNLHGLEAVLELQGRMLGPDFLVDGKIRTSRQYWGATRNALRYFDRYAVQAGLQAKADTKREEAAPSRVDLTDASLRPVRPRSNPLQPSGPAAPEAGPPGDPRRGLGSQRAEASSACRRGRG